MGLWSSVMKMMTFGGLVSVLSADKAEATTLLRRMSVIRVFIRSGLVNR
jgi:hypothetical protein